MKPALSEDPMTERDVLLADGRKKFVHGVA